MDDPVFRRIASPHTLKAAWKQVRRNGGGPGIDGMDIHRFAADSDRRLRSLSRALFGARYTPRPLLKVEIAKAAGGVRRLSVPTLVDRIAQTAAALVLDGMLDPHFSDASFAYRRGRSVGHALGRLLTYRLWGYRWAFDTDIADYFDTIPQDRLVAELSVRVSSPATLRLVDLWLSQTATRGVGVPQGGPISPLLSNLYLDPVDRAIASRRVRLIRYADNILLLATARTTAEMAGSRLKAMLADRGLALNADKTRLIRLSDRFEFLGHRIGGAGRVADAHETSVGRKGSHRSRRRQAPVSRIRRPMQSQGAGRNP